MSHAIRAFAVLCAASVPLILVWDRQNPTTHLHALEPAHIIKDRPINVTYNRRNNAPVYVDPRATLSRRDEVAALDAIQQALMTTADGGSYVWRPKHRRLNGIVQITRSFRDARARVCRHIVIFLNTGLYSRQAEGIACRLPSGIWTLSG
ncbi:MAG: hypothetical protein ACR2PA_15305 [Hyphomicrobiaceae bacterium]